MQLGSYAIQSPITTFAETKEGAHAQAGFAGLIGIEVLRRFRLILDYARQRVILEKNAQFEAPYEHDMSGMGVTFAGAHFQVEVVVDESPAAKAGLQAGDLLTHVDGQKVAHIGLDELRKAFKQAGNTHRLQVQRENSPHEATLTLRRLV